MKQNKETLKKHFETGDKPTQEQYSDLIDSYIDSKQAEGEANRRFVIDETGEVNVANQEQLSDYELKEYEHNTVEKYKVRLTKDDTVISEADLTNTFKPLVDDVKILKDIEFDDFLTIENGLQSNYSNIETITSTNGDFTLAKGEGIFIGKFIQKKQNIYNLEQCFLYLKIKSGYTNTLVKPSTVYKIRLRDRVTVGNYYVYTIDHSTLDYIGYTTNDKFDFGFRRFNVLTSEYTLSDIVANKLSLLKDGEVVKEIDLTTYIDDTNLSRLVSGAVDENGLATFARDDNSTFTIDLSNLKDTQLQADFNQTDNTKPDYIKGFPLAVLDSNGTEKWKGKTMQFDDFFILNSAENEVQLNSGFFEKVNLVQKKFTRTATIDLKKTASGVREHSALKHNLDKPFSILGTEASILTTFHRIFSVRYGMTISEHGEGTIFPTKIKLKYVIKPKNAICYNFLDFTTPISSIELFEKDLDFTTDFLTPVHVYKLSFIEVLMKHARAFFYGEYGEVIAITSKKLDFNDNVLSTNTNDYVFRDVNNLNNINARDLDFDYDFEIDLEYLDATNANNLNREIRFGINHELSSSKYI